MIAKRICQWLYIYIYYTHIRPWAVIPLHGRAGGRRAGGRRGPRRGRLGGFQGSATKGQFRKCGLTVCQRGKGVQQGPGIKKKQLFKWTLYPGPLTASPVAAAAVGETPAAEAARSARRASGVHKGGLRKGGFSNSQIITAHKLLKPPLRNPPLWTPERRVEEAAHHLRDGALASLRINNITNNVYYY